MMTFKRILLGLSVTAAVLAASSLFPPKLYSEGPIPPYQPGALPPTASDIPVRPKQPKFATVISQFANAAVELPVDVPVTQAALGAANPALAAPLSAGILKVDSQGRAQVYVRVSATDGQVLADLEAAGVDVETVADDLGIVQGRVHARDLTTVAALGSVAAVTPPDYGFVNVGANLTQGDVLLDFDDVRTTYGVDGTGVKVGVISDGIFGLAGAISSGDLPATTFNRVGGVLVSTSGGVISQSFRADGDLEAGLGVGPGAEGTAMLEIVHDIAPGAQLYFANFDTSLEFRNAVNFLASVTDVVVDDIGFFTPPYDQTSAVSSNTATALNVPGNPIRGYTVAVGNQADGHYQETFVTAAATECFFAAPDTCHLFSGTADTTDAFNVGPWTSNGVFVPNGGTAVVFLSWDDVFGNTTSNYDLCVFQNSPRAFLECAQDDNTATDRPAEVAIFSNTTGTDRWYDIVILNFNGASSPHEMELFVLGGALLPNFTTINYNTAGSSVPAQSDAGGGVLSAGAINASDPGTNDIAFYSSRGPTNNGATKPDITAVDGVDVSGSGGFPDPFFGTSAAAPHIAGLEALLLDLAPGLMSGDPAGDRNILRSAVTGTAVDLGPGGADNTYGAGRVNGPAAAASLVPGQPTAVSAVGGDGQAEVSWTAPAFQGAGTLVEYTVVSDPEGVTATVGAGSTSAVVTGLTNGTTYTFTVTATNAIGATSLPSAPSNAVLVETLPSFVDLALAKSASPEPVTVGEELTYTLTVTNVGATTATLVTLVDTLATSTAFQMATPSQGSCGESGGVVTCDLGDLGPGAVATTTIVVIPAVAGEVLNTASVSSAETDSNPVNNTAEATTTVAPIAEPQVDLSLTKSASPEPVNVGQELTYTLTVTNLASTAATSVTLVDTLATSTAFQTATPSQGSCGESGGVVTCNLGDLSPGAVATTTIVVIPSVAGEIVNTANVASAEADSNPADNTANATTTVVDRPASVDLSLAKSASPDPVAVGDELTYTLTVTNLASTAATSVSLVDTLATSTAFQTATPSQGSCGESGGTVTCNLGILGPGAMATTTIVVIPSVAETVFNSASVSSAETDSNPADNTANATTTVVDRPASVDLSACQVGLARPCGGG